MLLEWPVLGTPSGSVQEVAPTRGWSSPEPASKTSTAHRCSLADPIEPSSNIQIQSNERRSSARL